MWNNFTDLHGSTSIKVGNWWHQLHLNLDCQVSAPSLPRPIRSLCSGGSEVQQNSGINWKFTYWGLKEHMGVGHWELPSQPMSPTVPPGGWKFISHPLGRAIHLWGICTAKDKRFTQQYPKKMCGWVTLLGRFSDAGRTSNQCLGLHQLLGMSSQGSPDWIRIGREQNENQNQKKATWRSRKIQGKKIILREIKGDIIAMKHEKDAIMRNQVRVWCWREKLSRSVGRKGWRISQRGA